MKWTSGLMHRAHSLLQTFWRRLVGVDPDDTLGSNLRRQFGRVCMLLTAIIVFLHAATVPGMDANLTNMTFAVASVVMCIAYFVVSVIVVLFKASPTFTPNAARLLQDAATSTAFTIAAFAHCYRVFGFSGPEGLAFEQTDALYFSAVTFSTLGYGDFAPVPATRLVAALEAILGNLHLGMVVGAAFLAGQTFKTSDPDNKANKD